MKRFLQTFRDVIAILLLMVIAMLPGGIWLDPWEVNHIVLPLHFFFSQIFYLAFFVIGFYFLRKHLYRVTFDVVSFPPVFHRKYFGYAAVLLLLCCIGIAIVGGEFVFPQMDNYLFAQNAASLLGSIVVAPLIEEIAFRGVILTRIGKRYGMISAIILSSLLFGSVHLMNGKLSLASAVQLVVTLTTVGILLCIICISEGSIWASFTVHAIYNGIGLFIPVATDVDPDWPIWFVLNTDNQLISGGDYGIDCSLINFISYVISITAILILLKKHGTSLKEKWNSLSEYHYDIE